MLGRSLSAGVVAKSACVVAIAAAEKHTFLKEVRSSIRLVAGRGIQGDAHCGRCVQHLHDKAKDSGRPNLRQVHLIEEELIDHLQALGFDIGPGDLGENVRTRNISLVELDLGTRLKLGDDAVVEITGLRTPCIKIDRLKSGLRRAVTANRCGHDYMKSAVMAVVIESGTVGVGNHITVTGPEDGSRLLLGPV
jgi:MOSC domain-containing protein YiiM